MRFSFLKNHLKEIIFGLLMLFGTFFYFKDVREEKDLCFPLESIVHDEIAFFSPLELKELIDSAKSHWEKKQALTVFVVFDRMPKKFRTKWTSVDGQRKEKIRLAYSEIEKTWNLKQDQKATFYCIERDREEQVFRFYYGEHSFCPWKKGKKWTFSIGNPVLLSKEEIYSHISDTLNDSPLRDVVPGKGIF